MVNIPFKVSTIQGAGLLPSTVSTRSNYSLVSSDVLRFVALLWSTVGPTEKWLQLLGTLLSSEQTPHVGNEAEEGLMTHVGSDV